MIDAGPGRCPALEWEGGRFWCGLVRYPHKHIAGLEEKPWADEPIREMILGTGAFCGVCDSDD
jgi:hypothetical protein